MWEHERRSGSGVRNEGAGPHPNGDERQVLGTSGRCGDEPQPCIHEPQPCIDERQPRIDEEERCLKVL